MYIHEINRQRKNKKVLKFAESIIQRCSKLGFTVADVKDLANVLPGMIGEALTKCDENQNFTLFLTDEASPNNNADIRLKSLDSHH